MLETSYTLARPLVLLVHIAHTLELEQSFRVSPRETSLSHHTWTSFPYPSAHSTHTYLHSVPRNPHIRRPYYRPTNHQQPRKRIHTRLEYQSLTRSKGTST